MAIVRGLLALLVIAYGAFNTVSPVSTALYKLKDQWPAGWPLAQKALQSSLMQGGAAGADRFVPLMQATNWLQIALWLLADILYILAGLRLFGLRPRGAVPVFAVAFLLDVAVWATFKRLPIYDQTFSAAEQQQDFMIFGVLILVGIVMWFAGRRKSTRIQPTLLME